jgi:hypothetical protein
MFLILLVVALVVVGGALAAASLAKDPKERPVAADKALAKTILVRSTDLPGYSSATDTSPDEPTPPECVRLGYDPDLSDLVRTGSIHEPGLTKRQPSTASPLTSLEVDQDVDVMATPADARAAFRRQVSPLLPRCFAALFASIGTDKVQFKLHAIHAIPTAGASPLKTGWRIEMRVHFGALPATVYVPYTIELSFEARGRAVTDLLVIGGDKESRNVQTLHKRLQALVAARLKTAFP